MSFCHGVFLYYTTCILCLCYLTNKMIFLVSTYAVSLIHNKWLMLCSGLELVLSVDVLCACFKRLTISCVSHDAMVSLGWVSPVVATEGVTSIFFLKKTGIFFSHHPLPLLRCHPHLFSPEKLATFFCSSLSLSLISLGCHPWRVSPRTFSTCSTSFVHYSL